MCEGVIELIKMWHLSPMVVLGWALSGVFGSATWFLWREQRVTHREIRQWLRDDSEQKAAVAVSSVKVESSVESLERTVAALERALLISRGGDD